MLGWWPFSIKLSMVFNVLAFEHIGNWKVVEVGQHGTENGILHAAHQSLASDLR